jgi:mannose-6-phosphate isomerase-like protein (cupin superfamily)
MPTINRRNLLYAFGLASVTPLLPAQTAVTGKVSVAKPGESRFSYSTASQAKLSPCKLTSEDTGGALAAFELSALPQTGPFLHVHHREDEWYYVLSGEFLFKAGGEEHTLPAGASIWLPRGIPHVWANMGTTENKLILVCQPGGFEKFFEEMGSAMSKANAANAEKTMAAIFVKYGMEMLGPPLFKPLRQMH